MTFNNSAAHFQWDGLKFQPVQAAGKRNAITV